MQTMYITSDKEKKRSLVMNKNARDLVVILFVRKAFKKSKKAKS